MCHVTKRKILRDVVEFYIFIIDKFLNENTIKNIPESMVKDYIRNGLNLFEKEGLNKRIIEKFNEHKIDIKNYIQEKIIEKKLPNDLSEEKTIEKELHNELNDEKIN